MLTNIRYTNTQVYIREVKIIRLSHIGHIDDDDDDYVYSFFI